jgi:hypothetical protein
MMEIARGLSRQFAVEFTHFDVIPKNPVQGSLKGDYGYRWIARNVARLEKSILEGELLGLELISLADAGNDYLVHGILHLSVRTQKPYKPSGEIYIQIAPGLLERNRVGAVELYRQVLRQTNTAVDIRYGFVQPMALGKIPCMFASGVGGSMTTPLEAQDNALWARFHDNYDSEMRNLYWGNVITDRHCLRPFDETLEELRRIVGEGNVSRLSEDKAFFILPIEMSEIENRDDCRRYHEIRQQMAGLLRFMVPDEFVEKVTESAARTSEYLRSVSHDDSC